MAKITNEQIKSINNKCKNGWRLDTEYFIFHNEKTLVKTIEIDEQNYLRFTIGYDWNNKIILRISKFFHKQDDFFAVTSRLRQKTSIRRNTGNKKKY